MVGNWTGEGFKARPRELPWCKRSSSPALAASELELEKTSWMSGDMS